LKDLHDQVIIDTWRYHASGSPEIRYPRRLYAIVAGWTVSCNATTFDNCLHENLSPASRHRRPDLTTSYPATWGSGDDQRVCLQTMTRRDRRPGHRRLRREFRSRPEAPQHVDTNTRKESYWRRLSNDRQDHRLLHLWCQSLPDSGLRRATGEPTSTVCIRSRVPGALAGRLSSLGVETRTGGSETHTDQTIPPELSSDQLLFPLEWRNSQSVTTHESLLDTSQVQSLTGCTELRGALPFRSNELSAARTA